MDAGLLAGKSGLVMGVANQRSLAWAVAAAAAQAGARVAVTIQDERMEKRVAPLLPEIGGKAYICDVSDDNSIDRCFEQVGADLGRLDFLVHSIAFAKKEELQGRFIYTSRDGHALAHDISAYSLIAAVRAARPLMIGGGSIVALTFLGSMRVFPSYNVMGVAKASLESSVRYLASDLGPEGIRVNAVSAGPVKTLAASAVRGLNTMLDVMSERAPLRRNIDASEVADATVFLVSDLARGITGDVIHVDAGFHVTGL